MKKLFTFIALFCIVQMGFASDVLDISSQYLMNYSAPFTTTGEYLNGTSTRWERLAAPWVTVGDVTDATGTIITTWCTDTNHKTSLAFPADPITYPAGRAKVMMIQPGWDSFAGTVPNVKVYQTVTLPAGSYELIIQKGSDWDGASMGYLVVANGVGIPNVANLSTAIGSKLLSTAAAAPFTCSVAFTLTSETQISIGLVASFANVKKAITIAQFVLHQIVGANYGALSDLVTEAKSYTSATYPIGTIYGTYPQAKWDAMQASITASQALVANGQNTQAEVNAQVVALQTTIDELNASLKIPFIISDDVSTTWYQIRDKRASVNYWTLGEYKSTDGLTSFPLALIMTKTSNNQDDAQLFKIVKAPAPSRGYYLCNKLVSDMPLQLNVAQGMVMIDIDGSIGLTSTPWLFGATVYATNYRVFTEGNLKTQLNSITNKTPNYWGVWFPGLGVDDIGNDMEFVQVVEVGVTDFTAFNNEVITAQRMTADLYPLGTAEYQYSADKWNSFLTARGQAVAFLATEVPTMSQATVDSAYTVIKTAIDDLNASQNLGFFASDETNKTWYTISDNRSPNSCWKVGTFGTAANRLIMTRGIPAVVTDSILFKVVKAAAPLTGYYIYSKLNETIPLLADTSAVGNCVGITDTIPAAKWNTWVFTKSTSLDKRYTIAVEGAYKKQLNSYVRNPDFIAFYYSNTDWGNNWMFNRPVNTALNNVYQNRNVDIYVSDRMILSKNTSDKLRVFNIMGQRVDAKQQLRTGVYIVQVEGKSGSTKVLVQ